MNWSHVYGRARRFGKTTAMIEAAKKLGGVLVCTDARQAQDIEAEHGIKTWSIHRDANGLRGTSGPVLFDPDAVGSMAQSYENEIRRLEAELAKANQTIADLRSQIDDLESSEEQHTGRCRECRAYMGFAYPHREGCSRDPSTSPLPSPPTP